MSPSLVYDLLRSADRCFPGFSRGDCYLKGWYFLAALRHLSGVKHFLRPPPGSALERIVQARPDTLGAVIWPYQCAAWDAEERLRRIAGHYAEIDRAGPPFDFGVHDKLVLHDLSDEALSMRIILDQPRWFVREGGLSINIFVEDFRAMSMAFSLYRTGEGLEVFIGGIQGRKRDGVMDLYRKITRKCHGIRPRDLLFEYMRSISNYLGASRICAVSDAQRHHRHRYFGQTGFSLDYDEVWRDRGGVLLNDNSFEIPRQRTIRDLSEIKSNKRSLYRRRYEFLDLLDDAVSENLQNATICTFTDT